MKNLRFFAIIIFCIYINTYSLYAQFVTVDNNGFKLNGNKFYALTVNYQVDIVYNPCNPTTYFVAPHYGYGPTLLYNSSTQAGCYADLVTDFQRIAAMGFNSVRIVGDLEFDKVTSNSGTPSFYSLDVTDVYAPQVWVPNQPPYTTMFTLIQSVLNAATTAGLKVQLLAGHWGRLDNATFSNNYYVPYLQALATHFANNSTLYSYDFINEPSLHQDNNNYKYEICGLVESWHNAIHYNSKHLTTIGLWETSIGLWDPGLLKLDFLSYHVYPVVMSETNKEQKAIDRVKSTIKWFSEVSTLPWIIGEISFGASAVASHAVDHGSEAWQQTFANETLRAVRDCGGIGYSWWNFADVDDITYFNCGLLDVNANDKLVVSEFLPANFNPYVLGSSCTTVNYNYFNYSTYEVTGIIKDQNNQPIKNAVIVGVETIAAYPYHINRVQTFSKPDGSFSLFSNNTIGKVMINAVGAEMFSDWGPGTNLTQYPYNLPYPVTLTKFQPTSDIILNNVTISNQTINYEATHNIIVSNTDINSGAASTMKAENEIQIYSPFGVSSNSSFKAYIGNVYADCGSFSYRTANTTTPVTDTQTLSPDSQAISVYPNPVNETLYLKYNNELFKNSQIEIYDITGRLVLKEENASTITFENFKAGMYLLKFKSDASEKTFKINVMH